MTIVSDGPLLIVRRIGVPLRCFAPLNRFSVTVVEIARDIVRFFECLVVRCHRQVRCRQVRRLARFSYVRQTPPHSRLSAASGITLHVWSLQINRCAEEFLPHRRLIHPVHAEAAIAAPLQSVLVCGDCHCAICPAWLQQVRASCCPICSRSSIRDTPLPVPARPSLFPTKSTE